MKILVTQIKVLLLIISLLILNTCIYTYFLKIFPTLLIGNQQYLEVHKQMLHYLTTGSELNLPQSLTADEWRHIKDVFNIFNKLPVVLLALVPLLLFTIKKSSREEQIKILKLTQIELAAFSLVAALTFTAFFELFHYIFFPQGNWAFPADSTLIQLYPESFWLIATIAIILLALLTLEIIKQVSIKKGGYPKDTVEV